MPRYDDRYSGTTRLYVGHLSSRTRTRDLEHIFGRYGRVRDVDMKRDYAFVDFSDPRDADDARHYLDGRDIDGRRIIVEFAKGVPRGPGGVRDRDYAGRGPAPGSGRCFNCGIDGHWARDCQAGDWKNKCYRCGQRGHIERSCQNSPKKLVRGRSHPRSPVRSQSPRRGRSRSYSQSRSPARRVRDDRRSRSPRGESPVAKRGTSPPSEMKSRSPTPVKESLRERSSLSPVKDRMEEEQDQYVDSPRERSRSPGSPGAKGYDESPNGASHGRNGHNHSTSPPGYERSPVVDDDDDDDDNVRSPRGSASS